MPSSEMCATSQKTAFFIVTAVKTSNPMLREKYKMQVSRNSAAQAYYS
jgi:hypothetical protein